MKGAVIGLVSLLVLAWQGAVAQETDAAPPAWFVDMLGSLDEPDLFHRRDIDTFRVVVFGGSSPPLAIRVDYAGDDIISTVAAMRAGGGRAPTQRYRLGPSARNMLILSIDDSGFWDWPTADPDPPRVSNGYTVVLERVEDRRYHAVIRVNPGPLGPFDWAYKTLFAMNRLPLPEDANASPGPQYADWHGRVMLSMEEPDLAATGRGGEEAFRLTVLTRSDSPLAVRFQRNGGDFRIVMRRSSGKGWRADRARLVALANEVGQGTDEAAEIYRRTGVLLDTRTVPASAEDWDRLQNLLEEAEFWSRHQSGQSIAHGDAMWVFEGAGNGRYQILERPIDGSAPSYAGIAGLLLELAGEAE